MKIKILVSIILLSSVIGLIACDYGTPIVEDVMWKLESYGEIGNLQSIIQDAKITAEFFSPKSQIVGSGGCNNYFVDYEFNKNELTITPPIGSTMMVCPEPIMDQEQEYFELLETAETYQIQNGKLTISCSDNKILIFGRR